MYVGTFPKITFYNRLYEFELPHMISLITHYVIRKSKKTRHTRLFEWITYTIKKNEQNLLKIHRDIAEQSDALFHKKTSLKSAVKRTLNGSKIEPVDKNVKAVFSEFL